MLPVTFLAFLMVLYRYGSTLGGATEGPGAPMEA